MLLLACLSNKIQANETHPFYSDVKEAYKESKLIYNSKVESILYRKLPKPKDIFSELPEPKPSVTLLRFRLGLERRHRF